MPRKPKRSVGRPAAEIDWKLVDEHLEAGCPGTEIAGKLGVGPETLYRHCEQKHNVNFTAYSQQKKLSGDSILRKAQFDKAIGRTDLGDNTLLIWLGKTRLEQRETMSVTVAPETEKNFTNVMSQLDQMQKLRQNILQEKKDEESSPE